mmetsp:Transcript_1914/g.6221  ORF Transcript_1914/g.6221 Transcript_1914/m.6221 type:complete len:228 (+) Transcript_1914:233-916(+)
MRTYGARELRRPKTHWNSERGSPRGQRGPDRSLSWHAVTKRAAATHAAWKRGRSARIRSGDVRSERKSRTASAAASATARCCENWRTTSTGSLVARDVDECMHATAERDEAALHNTSGSSSARKPERICLDTANCATIHTQQQMASASIDCVAASSSPRVDARSPRVAPRSIIRPVMTMKGVATSSETTSIRPVSSVQIPYCRAHTYTVGAGGMQPYTNAKLIVCVS